MANVNGPKGPRGPSAPSTTPGAAPAAQSPSTESLPDAPRPQTGWLPAAPSANRSRGDGFAFNSARSAVSLTGASAPPPAPNPYAKDVQSALDTLTDSVQQALHQDAQSLAQGQTPWQQGQPLTDDQQSQLKDAAVQFFKDLPVGALDPKLAAEVEQSLKAKGLPVDGLAGKKIGDLGDMGGDIAKSLAGKLKDNSPATFYGLAAAGAAAVGYVGWSKGSAGLEKLGIKPEYQKGFFDDHLKGSVKVDWDPRLKNIRAEGTLDGNVDLGDNFNLSGSATFNSKTGFDSASVTGTYSQGDKLNASATAAFGANGLQSVGGKLTYNPNDRFNLSAGVTEQFLPTRKTTANLDAEWKIRDNVNFALSGSYDSTGDKRIGAGVTIRF